MAEFDKVTEIPVLLTSGDSVEMELGLSVDYPAGVYEMALTARLNGGSGAGADILSVAFAASGTLQTGTLDTAGKTPGPWSWSLRATNGAVTQTVGRGTLNILADPASADARSHAERMLDAIEARLEGRATKDVNSYAIAGRSLQHMSVDELMKWRSHYRAEVKNERGRGVANGGRKITLARFS